VPLAPGGAIDFVARQCGEVMSRQLGQQVIVENRTGAGGTIGMDSVLKAEPDGYTVLIANDNAASAPHILRLPHDYTKVLLPIIDIGHQPLVLGVHPTLGVNSIEEYLAHAKKNPAWASPPPASARTSTSSGPGSRGKPGSGSTTSPIEERARP
jgi:tripartite-type tricarboxylate transporter receptor subunit TctC